MQRLGAAFGAVRQYAWLMRQPGQMRHAVRLLRSFRRDYLIDTGTPWIVFDAAEFIRRRLPPRPAVFEYGSGGSTLFWLRHGARLTSIEHDAAWYKAVRQRVGAVEGFDYRHILPEPAEGGREVADPAQYASDDAQFRGYSFREYASQIDSFPDASFDVVLVDGRARASCVAHGARKVRPGGLLVLDNADRGYYTERNQAALGGFTCHAFVGVTPGMLEPTQTNCYVRL